VVGLAESEEEKWSSKAVFERDGGRIRGKEGRIPAEREEAYGGHKGCC